MTSFHIITLDHGPKPQDVTLAKGVTFQSKNDPWMHPGHKSGEQ